MLPNNTGVWAGHIKLPLVITDVPYIKTAGLISPGY